jgi:hypothetical protein
MAAEKKHNPRVYAEDEVARMLGQKLEMSDTATHCWQCYNCFTRVVLLTLEEFQMCPVDGVADSGRVSNVSCGWCGWHW